MKKIKIGYKGEGRGSFYFGINLPEVLNLREVRFVSPA